MGDDVGWREVVVVVGGLHVCTFKRTTLAVWELLCVCVFLFFFFGGVCRAVPSNPVPPGGRSGAGMLTRAAASVNPAR